MVIYICANDLFTSSNLTKQTMFSYRIPSKNNEREPGSWTIIVYLNVRTYLVFQSL